jgi:hypothetical protein
MFRFLLTAVASAALVAVTALGSAGTLTAGPSDGPATVVTADRGWCC